MKTLSLIAGLFLMAGHASYSQTSWGIKAGANLANVTYGSEEGTYEPRLGYHFGLMAEKAIGQQVFARSELLYSLAGSRFNYGGGKTNLDLNYLNLPVLLGYRPIPNLGVYLGPEIGYTLGQYGGRIKTENSFVLGIDGGILYNLTTALAVDLRYTYGLTNIENQHVVGIANQGREGSNRIALLGVNYFFKR